jgi:glycosyltransferase involved in cell wall biosynthesis
MLRVLHVVENFQNGSVENWLERMLRHARDRGIDLDWTFYCTLSEKSEKEKEIEALGARVIHSPVPIGRQWAFVRGLREELRRGNYDVLHCHHDLISGLYLVAAMGLPIKKRLVHVHNADESVLTPNVVKQLVVRPMLRSTAIMMADRVIGNSNHTLETFIGGRARRNGIDLVHYLGVDTRRFEAVKGNRETFRCELGLPQNSRILLFAGRMVPEKNPVFAVEVLAELRRLQPDTVGVFVGTGALAEATRRRAAELNVDDAFRYLGWRDDVPEIMCCSDWFILPHPEHPVEGFGFAIVEAQLAGLRMLLSRGILDDPLLPTAILRRLPLASGPRAWAEAALELLHESPPSRAAALAALRQSPFDMDTALADLVSLHQ